MLQLGHVRYKAVLQNNNDAKTVELTHVQIGPTDWKIHKSTLLVDTVHFMTIWTKYLVWLDTASQFAKTSASLLVQRPAPMYNVEQSL